MFEGINRIYVISFLMLISLLTSLLVHLVTNMQFLCASKHFDEKDFTVSSFHLLFTQLILEVGLMMLFILI